MIDGIDHRLLLIFFGFMYYFVLPPWPVGKALLSLAIRILSFDSRFEMVFHVIDDASRGGALRVD